MANGNTPKLAAAVLLLCIGATAYALSKDLIVGSAPHHTSAGPGSTISESTDSESTILESTAQPLSDHDLATNGDSEISSHLLTDGSQLNDAPSRPGPSSPAPSSLSSTNSAGWTESEQATVPEARTIAAVTESEQSFSVLAVALEAADLTDMLSEEGPFTIFAPTDDAFYALPPGQLEALLQPENRDQLVALLTHHVVEGKVLSSEFRTRDMHTVDNDTLDVSLESNVSVDGAQVIEIDIPASNGVIHAVDSVILPDQISSANASVGQSS